MRTITYCNTHNLAIRPILQKLLHWPLKIAQIVGQFPLTQSKDNELTFKWSSLPMFRIYINFLGTLFLAYYYFLHKREIVNNVMGPLTRTENYAGTLITLFVLFVDKALIIYSIIIRQYTIRFQTKLNTVLQEILNEVTRHPKLPPSATLTPFTKGGFFTPHMSHFEKERKVINKIGLILLGIALGTIFVSVMFHAIGLFNPNLTPFKTLLLIISCVLGACSIALPKLCYFYYIQSIICTLKVGFIILKETVKEQETKAMQSVMQSDEIGYRIESVLDMHSKLEKVVRNYNRAYGIQLLSCIIVSLVLIIGNSFLSCVNITFNSWYIILVTIPNTLLPFICFFLTCHNASQMSMEAQKTVTRLRNFKIKLRPELEWRITLHFTKAVSNPPSICPMSFAAINYGTVYSAVAMIATYIFILLQFKAGESETESGKEREFGWRLKEALLHGNFSANS